MVTIRVPATSANLGPGFDSFGLALNCYNTFTFTKAEFDALEVLPTSSVETCDLPVNPAGNLIFKAMNHAYADLGKNRPPLHVALDLHIPLERGMGSSSTAIAAALMATNHLNDNSYPTDTLLQLGAALEGHPDNIIPVMLGGVQLCDRHDDGTQESSWRAYPLPWPSGWRLLLLVPPYPLNTQKVRDSLPAQTPLVDTIFTLRKASLLTYSLLQADSNAFCASLTDRLHQPVRARWIPEFAPLKAVALDAGAWGMVISGAGPSLICFYPEARHQEVFRTLTNAIPKLAPDFKLLSLDVDTQGVQILSPTAEKTVLP